MNPLFQSLIKCFSEQESNIDGQSCLLIADENYRREEFAVLSEKSNITILTNRYDINQSAKTHKIESYFSDFDFSLLNSQFDYCLFRVAKERPINHHIFNQLKTTLKANGRLILGGKKNEGIKGYHQKLIKECGFTGSLIKTKDNYVSCLEKGDEDYSLDDKHYSELRELDTFCSKPGIYGWNKIDAGSTFLMETLLQDRKIVEFGPQSVIDLGCGYGFLSMEVIKSIPQKLVSVNTLCATDNNAAAVYAANENLKGLSIEFNIKTHVTADDCGSQIREQFDLLVCNPPFHQGFDSARDLSNRFVTQANKLLKTGSFGYFVVNVFIPLESIAQSQFRVIDTIANNGQFKIIRVIK